MTHATLICAECGKTWKRPRIVGARPKRCPECRRPARLAAMERLGLRAVPILTQDIPLGPCPCQGCGGPVWWMRWQMPYHGTKRAWCEQDGMLHRCSDWEARAVDSLARARDRWDNGGDGSSVEPNRIANGARVSATTRGAGVVLPHEVVAR